MDAQAQVQALRGLATALAHPLQTNDGVSVSLVAGRDPNAAEINSMLGFIYKADGSWVPLDIDWADVDEHYALLIKATCDDDTDGWLKSLVQVGYPSGKTTLQFDHENADRWTMNPQAWDELPLDIRPEL